MGGEKYLLQQPGTLESMAIKKIGEWIASLAEKIEPSLTTLVQRYPTKAQELLSRQIEMMRNHIQCRLPGKYYDEAMTELKGSLCRRLDKVSRGDVRHTILRRMIETLFTKNLTSFSFINVYWENFEDSFYSKSHLIPGLAHLSLYRIDINDILKCVENNFKLIETLNLSDCEINDDCIDILIRLKNLRSVDLSYSGVTERHIETLLTSCPNIEHIVTGIDIACVIENIVNLEKHDGRRFNLKSYRTMCDSYTTLKQQQLVVKMCPTIEKMGLIRFESQNHINPKKYLKTFQDLQSLRELELANCEFYTNEVKELLGVRGHNLVILNLWKIPEIDFSAIKHICLMCPNLQSLELKNSIFSGHNNFEGKNCEFSGIKDMSPLIHLKTISLSLYWIDYPAERSTIFLLSICPNIEYIDISRMSIRDMNNLILDVLEKNPTKLKYLRELTTCRKLSESVIAQIAENCVDHPEILFVQNGYDDN